MLRFQTALASLLGSALVAPVFLGQGSIATLEDALAGTQRALEVLKSLEQRLQEDPGAALGLLLSATEPAALDEPQLDARFESLRNEVSLLQMELDALQSPQLAAGTPGAGAAPLPVLPLSSEPAWVTTGLDDSLRALLASDAPVSPVRPTLRMEGADAPDAGANAYSADPLRHGIACYRAGRHAEALALLAPIEGATALYWTARTLERLERLDEAVATMERALAKASAATGETPGFEPRRAESDLEFMRWKRDFLRGLRPEAKAAPR
jgi:tetratricopeptide (TPR) repeat protein